MSQDTRTEAQIEAATKATLIKNGMPPDLVDTALEAWMNLAGSSEEFAVMLENNDMIAKWMSYGFMQGFVAGNRLAVHKN